MVSDEKRRRVLQRRWNRRIAAIAFPLLAMGLVGLSLFGPFGKRGENGRRHAIASQHRPTMLSEAEKASAARLYGDHCSACHGVQLEGVTGPALSAIGERRAYGKIVRIILNGKGRNKPSPMPAGLMNASEAELVARWLLSPDAKLRATGS